jgi:hypothetical protein
MRRGARSIRGAMGAYTLAAFVAVLLLGGVLYLAWPTDPTSYVTLAADSTWVHAVLDDGTRQVAVERGQRVPAPPGDYRVTLLDGAGRSELRSLTVAGALTSIAP